jgi:hypothetical protein
MHRDRLGCFPLGKRNESNLIWTTQLTAKLTPLKSFPSENEQMFLFT